ncbi:hypothetical protein HAX54_007071 [Datura stramonium]|uniref:Uncharacterized protein n=1 Tax=Datura stramonium TaxID=4076 RepID=A0ABS8WUH2_DATST|nr:hypothetical protein [Datura stramonium]
MQIFKVAFKSKISKGKDTQANKEVKYSSLTPKAATTTASEAIDVAHKRKRPSSSSGNSAKNSPGVVPFYSDTSKPLITLNGDGITSATSSSNESNPEPHSVAKNSHLPLDEVKGQVTNDSLSTKLMLPSSKNVELFQPNLTTDAKARANQIRCSNTSKDLIRTLQQIASNFGTQDPISTFKLSYVSEMWHPCVNVLHNSQPSPRKALKSWRKVLP